MPKSGSPQLLNFLRRFPDYPDKEVFLWRKIPPRLHTLTIDPMRYKFRNKIGSASELPILKREKLGWYRNRRSLALRHTTIRAACSTLAERLGNVGSCARGQNHFEYLEIERLY
jgi:hypothetical protein